MPSLAENRPAVQQFAGADTSMRQVWSPQGGVFSSGETISPQKNDIRFADFFSTGGHGPDTTATATGHGPDATATATGGHGPDATATAGHGPDATATATGHGPDATATATGGHGPDATATAGHGPDATAGSHTTSPANDFERRADALAVSKFKFAKRAGRLQRWIPYFGGMWSMATRDNVVVNGNMGFAQGLFTSIFRSTPGELVGKAGRKVGEFFGKGDWGATYAQTVASAGATGAILSAGMSSAVGAARRVLGMENAASLLQAYPKREGGLLSRNWENRAVTAEYKRRPRHLNTLFALRGRDPKRTPLSPEVAERAATAAFKLHTDMAVLQNSGVVFDANDPEVKLADEARALGGQVIEAYIPPEKRNEVLARIEKAYNRHEFLQWLRMRARLAAVHAAKAATFVGIAETLSVENVKSTVAWGKGMLIKAGNAIQTALPGVGSTLSNFWLQTKASLSQLVGWAGYGSQAATTA